MSEDDELWAYDEPHESGGNAHITMTRRQAVDWTRHIYGNVYNGKDDEAFKEWVAVHWAYREEKKDAK